MPDKLENLGEPRAPDPPSSISGPHAPAIVVILGPTASGKTRLALELAGALDAEILGADSRQVYRRLDIGTAKPAVDQRARVQHHLVDHIEPSVPYNAYRYQQEFRSLLPRLIRSDRTPLVVGGTGLYLKAAIEGLSPDAPRDLDLRAELHARLEQNGPESLHQELQNLDPESARRIHERDRIRLVRALEICRVTARPASTLFRDNPPQPLDHPVHYFGLHWSRNELYRRIEQRTETLFARGWIDEVEALLASGLSPEARSMQSLGYREIVEHLHGRLTGKELRERVLRSTKRYAKRQLTWFRALPVTWLDASEPAGRLVQQVLDLLQRPLDPDPARP